ncbi:hypothetical protein ACWEOZ_17855 [Actinoplanes sp. NPDC004185]
MTLSIIAIVISAVAIGVSVWTGLSNKRSAVAAEQALVAAEKAADASAASARSAAQVAKAELERDHESYRPRGVREFVLVRNERTGRDNVFFDFTPDRSYRLMGDGMHEHGGRVPLSSNPGPILQAGHRTRLYVGELEGTPLPKSLSLRFWPPASTDPGEPWECPCDRPVSEGEDPHWVWNVPVVPPKRRPKPMVAGA